MSAGTEETERRITGCCQDFKNEPEVLVTDDVLTVFLLYSAFVCRFLNLNLALASLRATARRFNGSRRRLFLKCNTLPSEAIDAISVQISAL